MWGGGLRCFLIPSTYFTYFGNVCVRHCYTIIINSIYIIFCMYRKLEILKHNRYDIVIFEIYVYNIIYMCNRYKLVYYILNVYAKMINFT